MIDLSDNTNLWGMCPAAERAIRELPIADWSRYPSWNGARLGEAAARYVGVTGAAIVGCGSDEMLDAVMRAMTAPGDRIAYSTPTFSMVPVYARANRLEAVPVPLGDNFDLDADRLVSAGAALLYVCAPNNPTGTAVSRSALEYVLEHTAGTVLLDEAYAEFAASTNIDLVARYERLVVTRTLSKAFGLAGLRAGYAVGNETLLNVIGRNRGPYMLNVAAEAAAVAALSDAGVVWMRSHAVLAQRARDQLIVDLRSLGLSPVPSDANFVFAPLAHAWLVAERMRRGGVVVRAFENLPLTIPAFAASEGRGLRIGVGPAEQMAHCIDALAAALAERGDEDGPCA